MTARDYDDPLAGHDITVLSTRAACRRALRNPALSSNPGGVAAESGNLVFMDGLEHARVRAVVREAIARVEPLPDALVASIEETVAGLGGREEFDLVADFARPVAAMSAAAVLGAGEPFDARFIRDLEAATANLDVWFSGTGGADTAALRVAMFFLRARNPDPHRGLATLRSAHAAGRLTEDELTLTPVVLAHAAYENSRNFLAAAALRLVGKPQLRGALREDGAAVVRRLAGEICPTRVVMRRAVEPVTLTDAEIAAGTKIAVRLGPEPDSAGAAFGLGPHACPGSAVAIAEAVAALRALAPVLADDYSIGTVHWRPHPAFHGPTQAPATRLRLAR